MASEKKRHELNGFGVDARRRWGLLSASLLSLACAHAVAAQEREPAAPPAAEAATAEPAAADAPPPDDDTPIASPSPPPEGVVLPEVAPIIPDDEFRKAIPPISAEDDPELDKPLESIADFEKRVADAAKQKANGTADAVPQLESFDVQPVQFVDAEPEGENRQVAYSVQVNGLAAADDSTDADLSGLFGDLSALYDGDGKADNFAMLRARLSNDAELMQRILSSEGYYDGSVDTRIDRAGRERGQPVSAVIDVKPGPRYSFSDIILDAKPTVPPGLIADNFPLAIGEPIVAERVQGAEAAISLKLPEEGYPFAKVGQRDILLDGDKATGVYTLPIDIGPRARFGGFASSGKEAFGADHVAIMARFKRGDLYDSRKVDDLRQALVATGLFATVSVEPQATGESAGDRGIMMVR